MQADRFSVHTYSGYDVYGILSCPECGDFNLMFANDERLVCMCGKCIVDLGEKLASFVRNNKVQVVDMAA